MAFSPDEAARLVNLNAPILCFDTCSLLDVVRDPCRDTYHANNAKSGMALLDAMESGTKLVALLADQVLAEFNKNHPGTLEEAEQNIKKLRSQIERIDGITAAFNCSISTDTSHWNDHVARADSVVQRWMKCVVRAPQSSMVPINAFRRVMEARAPARQGKDSLQDCVVIETYLEAVSTLRKSGLTSKVVFVSSNVDDFADPSRKFLKAELMPEFSELNMLYAKSFGVARGLLGV